jgi:hypothetical protein
MKILLYLPVSLHTYKYCTSSPSACYVYVLSANSMDKLWEEETLAKEVDNTI